jgi:hypothetical protein
MAKKAAFVAAVAQQPVVQPRRSSPSGFLGLSLSVVFLPVMTLFYGPMSFAG